VPLHQLLPMAHDAQNRMACAQMPWGASLASIAFRRT